MKKTILLCAGLLIACFTKSQTQDRKWNIGFHGGLTQYNGDRGQNFYATDQAAYGFAGLSVSRYLGKHFDASLFLTRGELGNVEPLSPWSPPNDNNHFFTPRIFRLMFEIAFLMVAVSSLLAADFL